jgi:hypothetical protein
MNVENQMSFGMSQSNRFDTYVLCIDEIIYVNFDFICRLDEIIYINFDFICRLDEIIYVNFDFICRL